MQDTIALGRGLSIVSQCKERTGDIWHAHYGVAAIACYFFVQENQLPIEVTTQIIDHSDTMLNKHGFPQPNDVTHRLAYTEAESIIIEPTM